MKQLTKFWILFTQKNIALVYGVTLLVNFIYTSCVVFVLLAFDVACSQNVATTDITDNNLGLFLAPLLEEIIFRWIPMLIVVSLSKRYFPQYKLRAMVISLVMLSFIFGYLHGNMYNILLQGVSGLFISAFYLRAYLRSDPSQRITRTQLIPLASATTFHVLCNVF